ncbi:dehydrogenase [Escherichia coli]|uniref:Dehydrogenase n=1 Tax=Escherichia coli TaxID=562 RepID=A0A2X3K767_ECOLX|nr:dehydrogenase [Escherichia coli]
MKSILIEKPNQLAIVEREIPTPSAGESASKSETCRNLWFR